MKNNRKTLNEIRYASRSQVVSSPPSSSHLDRYYSRVAILVCRMNCSTIARFFLLFRTKLKGKLPFSIAGRVPRYSEHVRSRCSAVSFMPQRHRSESACPILFRYVLRYPCPSLSVQYALKTVLSHFAFIEQLGDYSYVWKQLPGRGVYLVLARLYSISHARFTSSFSSLVASLFERPEQPFCLRFIPCSCVRSLGVKILMPLDRGLVSIGRLVSSIAFFTG